MQQAQWVKKILDTKPQKRYRVTKKRKRLKGHVSSVIQKRHFTKKNIIAILNHYQIFSIRKLRSWNIRNPHRIPYQVIRQLFGSWAQCKKHLNYDFTTSFKFNQQKVIATCAHFKILSREQYKKAHELQPEIFPRAQWISIHFHGFKNFIKLVRANIVQDILTRFFKLKAQLGRYPTKLECKKNMIEIDVLYQFWTKQQLKDMVSYLEKQYERQQRKNNKIANNIET